MRIKKKIAASLLALTCIAASLPVAAYTPEFSDELSRVSLTVESDDYEAISLLKDAGLSSIRYPINWHKFEPAKNTWDYEYLENRIQAIKNEDIHSIVGIGTNNNLYSNSNNIRAGVETKSNLDGFARYCRKLAEYLLNNHPEIRTFMIWNEPNSPSFWRSDPNPSSYFNLVKEASAAFKEYMPDCTIIAGVAANPSMLFLDQLFECGIYQYADVISLQPYVTPSNADQGTLERRLYKLDNTVYKYGGWKEKYISEIGWYTYDTVSEEDQAINLIKTIVFSDEYDFSGTNIYELVDGTGNTEQTENHYGLVRSDKTKKTGYHAVAQNHDILGGADYIGKITDSGNSSFAYVYRKNDQIIAVAWTKQESEKLSALGITDYKTACDLYGNELQDPALTFEPIYITFNDRSLLYSALKNSLSSYYNTIPASCRSSALEELAGLDPAQMSAQAVLDAFEENYNIAYELISGNTSEQELRTRLMAAYKLHNAALKWGALYTYLSRYEPVLQTLTADSKIRGLENELHSISDSYAYALPYSEAILKQAKKYSQIANALKNSTYTSTTKGASVRIYNDMADKLTGLSRIASQVESASYDKGFLIVASPSIIKESGNTELSVNIENRNNAAFNGSIRLLNRFGNTIYKADIRIPAKSTEILSLDINISETDPTGKYFYRMELVNEDAVVSAHSVFINTQTGPYTTNTITDENQAESTPAENIFTVNNKEYILLDYSNDMNSAFFVMEENIKERRLFDEDVYDIRFDAEDSNNIAYYLNNGYYVDPDIRNYIDFEHMWLTEAGYGDSECPTDYITICGISLISVQEWLRYAGKFGYAPTRPKTIDTWWMRTPGTNISTIRYVSCKSQSNLHTLTNTQPRGIRPVYYLNRDFFKKIKPTDMGANVKKAIRDTYPAGEMMAADIYNKSELAELGYTDDDMLFSEVSYTDKNGEPITSCAGQDEVNLRLVMNKDKSFNVIFALYDALNRFIACTVQDSSSVMDINVKAGADAPEVAYSKCFFWNLDTLEPCEKCIVF